MFEQPSAKPDDAKYILHIRKKTTNRKLHTIIPEGGRRYWQNLRRTQTAGWLTDDPGHGNAKQSTRGYLSQFGQDRARPRKVVLFFM